MKYIMLMLISVGLMTMPAHAYIDPGTGGVLISSIIGFFVAIGVLVKTYWYKLKSIFSSKNDDDETE